MDYVRLGNSGMKVSRVCLGMMTYGDPGWRPWVLDESAAEPIVRRAVESGITFFDTADVYSLGVSEEVTGRLLAKLFPSRDDYVLATKVRSPMGDGPNDRGLSRKHIMASIDASLRRLGTDHVDLYQIHRFDPDTPVDETMGALHDIVTAGKARYLGASSMWAWQFAKAQHAAELNGWIGFVSMQNHYNLLYREEEREMIPLCIDQGVGVVPWSPLARGWLTGKVEVKGGRTTARAGSDAFAETLYGEGDLEVVSALSDVAGERGLPPAQVALAWMLQRPGLTAPIVGATKPAHVDDAVAAVDVSLAAEEVGRLEALYRPHAIAGHR
jgi:aryl-alcohol dehydrogenase-like predicted oxidoreductase